ncbi:outer membrane protein assembly factor BamB family protein [Streptomyces caniferus]|uniref:outer membrane protein assembly factor BamB family protein n=1 Tax=Streptomyces caniferus TaxID=285557 RepID=UPI003805CD7B
MGQPQGPPPQGYPVPQVGQQPPPPYAQNQGPIPGQVPGQGPFPGGLMAPQFQGGPGQPGTPGRSGVPVPLILTIVMVLLVAAGVGGYFLFSGDSAGSGAARPANAIPRKWEAASPVSEREGQNENGLRSMWFNNDDIIYGDGEGVRAYNRKTGKKKWTVKTPKGAGEVCAMSAEPSDDGVGAVVFDAGGDDCSYLAAVDTDTGRTLWSKNLQDGSGAEHQPRVVVNKKVVAVTIGRTYAGFSVGRGAKVWELTARGHECTNSVGLSPQYLAVASDCSDAKPKKQLALQDLEYDSIHSTVTGEDHTIVRTLSDWPLTLLTASDNSPEAQQFIQTYEKNGKPDHTFQLSGELKDMKFEPRNTYVDEDEQTLVTGYGANNGLAAMDMKTGKLLWKKRGSAAIAGVNNQGLMMVTDSPDSGASAVKALVVAVGLRDGKEKVKGTLYEKEHNLPAPSDMSLALDRDNNLFIQSERLTDNRPSVQAFEVPFA